MITEDFCSFEVAKLLKEKGFNECCRAFRSPNGHLFYSSHDIKNFEDGKTIGGAVTAPTLQMAMKWLREVHNIFIVIDRHYFVVDKISHIASGFKYSIEIKTINTVYTYNDYKSYEQAVETALKYTLENLI